MPDARREEEELPEDEEPLLEGDALDLDALKNRGDVEGILELAKAYRAGKSGVSRDLKKCFEAYKVAAEIGNVDADYAIALFHLTGGVVPQDFKEGTTRLRAAAEKGSVPAKVYLGNLYEQGIHYKADKEKADVWYRNAARGAQVESEPGSDDYRQELAELGCVRYVLELNDAGEMDRLLPKARAHGYGLKIKDGSSRSSVPSDPNPNPNPGDRPTLNAALENAEQLPPAVVEKLKAQSQPDAAEAKTKPKPESKPEPKPEGPTQASIGLGAFGFAVLFVLAGAGAGYAATHGARVLLENGTKLPGIGTHVEYVFPIVLALFGVWPAGVGYQLGTWLKGILIGVAMGGVGWVAWGTGMAAFHASRIAQAYAFGLAGFLAGLLVLGLLGGTKKKPARLKKKPASG
jgi:hypothetical protein